MTPYTIIERNGCCLVSGALPLRMLSSLANGMPKGAVMDAHAARVLGVSFAMGMPENLRFLVEYPEVRARARERVAAEADRLGLSAPAREWLALGRQGISSLTIFSRLTELEVEREDHPHDAGDFGRCRRLIEDVPEFGARLSELAAASSVWAILVARWGELCALMDAEAPRWREMEGVASLTSAAIKAIVDGPKEGKA